MTDKCLNFQLDEAESVAMTLSKSARISLTDIAAATIGNLSEESQWGDNSTSSADVGLSVLRPWEDNSESDKSEEITQNTGYPDKQPPSYQEHLKRKLDEDDVTEEVSKRHKTEPANVTKDTTVLYSYIVPATSTHNSIQEDSQNSLLPTNDKNLSQQMYDHRSGQFNSFQKFTPIVITHNTLQGDNTQNSLQNVTTQNSMQTVTTQNSLQEVNKNSMQDARSALDTSMQNVINQNFKKHYLTIDPEQFSFTMEPSSSSCQNSNKTYLPWTNTPVLNEKKNIQNVQQQNYKKQYMEQTPSASSKLLTNPSGFMDHKPPPLLKPHHLYPIATQSYQTQPLPPACVNWQTPNISDQQKEKQPSRSEAMSRNQSLPPLQLVPTFLQMSDILQSTGAPEDNKPMQDPWQHMTSPYQLCESQIKPSDQIKQEPATPIGKGLMSTSKFDSPGMDSRFTESLSNLLGSPPPDSPLSKNPFLGDLQALLNRECKREIVPQSLFGMQGSNKENTETKKFNVFERERNLQERFTNLQSSHPEDIRQLSSMFRYQSALIETERFRTLHECQYPGSYRESVNRHYDNQLHKVMDRVERSVELLEHSNKESKLNKVAKMRPHLSKDAVRLMEHWYQQNLKHPYPTNSVIEMLAHAGNIGVEQVKKWFANKRNRSSNTRTLTEIAMQKRKLGQMPGQC